MKILWAFALLLLSSCTTYRYVYTATPPNNPVFTEKGASSIAGYYSTASSENSGKGYVHGFDLHAGYAISEHWAIKASYLKRYEMDNYGFENNLYLNSSVKYDRTLLGVGGGYFIPLNPKKTITVNFFGGYRTGKFSFKDKGLTDDSTIYSRFHRSNVSIWDIQPAINFVPGKYLSISLVWRFSFLNYYNIETNYSSEELNYFSLDHLGANNANISEPSLLFRLGIPGVPWIKLTTVFSGIGEYQSLKYGRQIRTFSFSAGLHVDPSGMFEEKP